jgi:hypothetical protein
MSLDDVDRPLSGAVPETEVIHRRWLLSKRPDDGRPMLVREDKVIHPTSFASRARRPSATQAADTTSGTPAFT